MLTAAGEKPPAVVLQNLKLETFLGTERAFLAFFDAFIAETRNPYWSVATD